MEVLLAPQTVSELGDVHLLCLLASSALSLGHFVTVCRRGFLSSRDTQVTRFGDYQVTKRKGFLELWQPQPPP